ARQRRVGEVARCRADGTGGFGYRRGGLQQYPRSRRAHVHEVHLPLRARGHAASACDRCGDHAHDAATARSEATGHRRSSGGSPAGPRSPRQDGSGEGRMIQLEFVLMLAGLLFALSVAGIFLNRKNVILLLMCIELMLLAVNFNFVAFARQLGDLSGQVYVFFIMTVAAAEAAIGLAILVVLFREKKSINVERLDEMKG